MDTQDIKPMTYTSPLPSESEAALAGFAELWPQMLAIASREGILSQVKPHVELARQVYQAAFFDGARYGIQVFTEELLAKGPKP